MMFPYIYSFSFSFDFHFHFSSLLLEHGKIQAWSQRTVEIPPAVHKAPENVARAHDRHLLLGQHQRGNSDDLVDLSVGHQHAQVKKNNKWQRFPTSAINLCLNRDSKKGREQHQTPHIFHWIPSHCWRPDLRSSVRDNVIFFFFFIWLRVAT
jgi:hypothetical protein